MAKKKGKLREEQEAAMDAYTYRLTAAHARHFRKVGKGNGSEGARILAEKDMQTLPEERRKGSADRRKLKT